MAKQKKRIAVTTCADVYFIPGVIGLIRSVRRFHGDEIDIHVFIDRKTWELEEEAKKHRVTLHLFSDIEGWVRPLIYTQKRYLEDSTHYYHPDFYIREGWPDHHLNREAGLGKVHHLHPLNVKAYCTGYCLVVEKYDKVVHIDSDAFLLGPLTPMLEQVPENGILGFDDGTEELPHMEKYFGTKKPEPYDNRYYSYNAGVVFYNNGPGIQALMQDFMFYVDSAYHYSTMGDDQRILRGLTASYHLQGKIKYEQRDRKCWNPTWNAADDLTLKGDEWINEANGQRQHVWHGAGTDKMWKAGCRLERVREAWKWVGGDINQDYWSVEGSLILPHCEYLREELSKHIKPNTRILEIGTQFGRTAIAMASLVVSRGKECHLDTVDVYEEPSPDYPKGIERKKAEAAVRNFALQGKVSLLHVLPTENLVKKLGGGKYDFIFIDGDHSFKHVAADCVVAREMLAPGGMIAGDDWQMESVREAVTMALGKTRQRGSVWVKDPGAT